MNGAPVEARWPLYVTAWCFVAGILAVQADKWIFVVLAAIQVVCVWAMWLISRAANR